MDMSLSLPLPIQNKKRKQCKASSSSNPPLPTPFPPSQPPEDDTDRLTALPDPLRLFILSLLPLSSAIRTGVLSTQWKNLWKSRHHPALTPIDIRLDIPSDRPPFPFIHKISNILTNPEKLFPSLHLSLLPQNHHLQELHNLLHNAAARGVEDLSLDLRSTSPCFRRPYINLDLSANFSSLVRLTLAGFRLSSPPSYFKNLLNLEYLSLYRINITDTVFKMIVSNCPLLRSLDVRRCPDLKKVVIVGKKIVNVIVVECAKVSEVSVRGAKALNKFHFKGEFAREYRIRGAEHLKDVYMCSDGLGRDLPLSNWVAVVHGFHNVTVLTLCRISLQYIMAADANAIWKFETFPFLKELQLLMFSLTEENLSDIYKFFSFCHFPNLERLFIELPAIMNDTYLENLLEVKIGDRLQSDFANLKTIKINGFKDHQYEMSLVRFFLSNCINLEDLFVVCPKERKEESIGVVWDIHCHILQFFRVKFDLMPKLSKTAKIVVSEDDDICARPTHEAYCKV